MAGSAHYQEPGWFDRNVFNRLVAGMTRLGVSVWGSRVLEVRGRKSGEPRQVPLNVLAFDGNRYLVAPRGHTQWVRNLRAAGEGDLLLGGRREHFRAAEVDVSEREPILRAYLRRWKWEVGQFFGGVGPESTAAEIDAIAGDHPIFRIEA
jgi:deazaflavin-dependent oxidoreductase (nitroreductase family)